TPVCRCAPWSGSARCVVSLPHGKWQRCHTPGKKFVAWPEQSVEDVCTYVWRRSNWLAGIDPAELSPPPRMIPRASSPLVEVFLLVEQPRQRLSHWSQALGALDEAAAPPLASVDAYYDPASNQALFGLRYDEQALGATGMSYIVEVALLAEIG